MSAFRRVEPAFCRGCGRPWAAGADACPSCGEAIAAAPVEMDAGAARKLRAALVAASLVVGARWIVLLVLLKGDLATAGRGWLTALAVLAALAVGTSRLWYPGRWRGGEGRRVAPAIAGALGLALVAGVAIGGVAGSFLGAEPALALAADAPLWMAVAAATVLLEELFFRGIVFDGVAAIGGVTNAAIAASVFSALASFDPVAAAIGAVASVLRAWGGSVGAALAFRAAWLVGLLAAALIVR